MSSKVGGKNHQNVLNRWIRTIYKCLSRFFCFESLVIRRGKNTRENGRAGLFLMRTAARSSFFETARSLRLCKFTSGWLASGQLTFCFAFHRLGHKEKDQNKDTKVCVIPEGTPLSRSISSSSSQMRDGSLYFAKIFQPHSSGLHQHPSNRTIT